MTFITVSIFNVLLHQKTAFLGPLSTMNMVSKRMGDRYALGFAPALIFLQRQLLCRFYKRLSNKTIII